MESNLLILAREFKKLKDNTLKVLEMPVGPQGEKGDKGDKGDVGETGPKGDRGVDGVNGINGRDGRDGKDGQDGVNGVDGSDGVSVVDAEVDFDGQLKIKLSDGTEINAGGVLLQEGAGGGTSVTLKQQYSGPKVFVQPDEPLGASTGDLWYQTTP